MAITIPVSEIFKQAAILCSLDEPSGTIYSSTDKDLRLLHLVAIETGQELLDKFFFPQLVKTHTFTTGANDTQYTLPGDFFAMIPDTQVDRTNLAKIFGPASHQLWNEIKYFALSSLSNKAFIIRGADTTSGQFFLDPEPDANETIAFEYVRSQWFVPKAWVASESVTSGTTYRFSSGNIYLAQTTATTGATPPSHTTGTASDGTVSWLYVTTQTYGTNNRFQADTDISLIDDDLIRDGMVWRFKEKRGVDFARLKDDWEQKTSRRYKRLSGSRILSLSSGGAFNRFNRTNSPEGSFGL